MQIQFEKISTTPKAFKVETDGVRLEGTLQKNGHSLVLLDAKLQGELSLICDRCGCDHTRSIDTELKLTISDRVSENKDDLDIIEFLDGVIDLSYILESEMNAIKGEYHYCDKCSSGDQTLEIEF